MNIFDWFFQWIFPEINLEDFNEPHDSLGGLDFDEKQDILEHMTSVHEDSSPCNVTPAIYDPECYPKGAKTAEDSLIKQQDRYVDPVFKLDKKTNKVKIVKKVKKSAKKKAIKRKRK